MIQMTGEIKLHGLGSGVHESVHGWLAVRKKPFSKRTSGGPDADFGGDVEATRLASKDLSGSSSNKLMASVPPFLDEIVTVDDVVVATTSVVGQGP
jgi:mlo protein